MVSSSIRSMLKSSWDACMILNLDGDLLERNDAAKALFGKYAHISDIMQLDDPWDELAEELTSSPHRIPSGVILKNGSCFPAKISFAKLDPEETNGDGELFCAFVQPNETLGVGGGNEVAREKEMLKGMIDSSFDPIFAIDEAGTIKLVNQSACEVFGYTEGEFLGNNVNMICPSPHKKRHDSYLSNYFASGKKKVIGQRRELEAVRKDGTKFPILLGVKEIVSPMGERYFCGFVQDKTELSEKAALAQGLIDSSFDPMFGIDRNGIIKLANNAATTVFGWAQSELIGQKINMIMPKKHSEQHDQYMQNYHDTGIKRVIGQKRSLMGKHKNGRLFPIQLGVNELSLENGESYYCGYVRDRSEVAFKAEMLKAMIDSSYEAMFQINEKGIIQVVNLAACTVFGWKEEEFVGKNISMIAPKEHADNHNLYLSSYLTSGLKRVIGKNRELTAVKKDGTKFPIQLGVKEVKSSEGTSHFCGFVKDLTKSKKDEERLRRHQQLTTGMLNSAFDPMFQISQKGIIQMVNQAACDHFGYSQEEFLGTNIAMITGPEHCDKHNSYLQRYLQTREKRVIGRRRELTAYRKDGTSMPIELGVSEIDTIWGEKYFCGFIRDISRQKYDAEQISEHEKLTEGIFGSMLDPMLTVDEKLTIYSANEQAALEFGVETNDLIGSNLEKYFAKKYSKAHKEFFDKHFRYRTHNKDQVLKSTFFLSRNGNKAVFQAELSCTELYGPFPILLGSIKSLEHEPGSRIFSVFFRVGKDDKGGSWGIF